MIGILSLPMAFMLWQIRMTADWIVRPTIVVALHQLALRFINLPRELDPLPHTVVLLSVVILVPSVLPILGIGLGLRKIEKRQALWILLRNFRRDSPDSLPSDGELLTARQTFSSATFDSSLQHGLQFDLAPD
jgi:hypothetical protein